jgi:hypothetical protein
MWDLWWTSCHWGRFSPSTSKKEEKWSLSITRQVGSSLIRLSVVAVSQLDRFPGELICFLMSRSVSLPSSYLCRKTMKLLLSYLVNELVSLLVCTSSSSWKSAWLWWSQRSAQFVSTSTVAPLFRCSRSFQPEVPRRRCQDCSVLRPVCSHTAQQCSRRASGSQEWLTALLI